MVIGKYFPLAAYQKAGSEDVNTQRWPETALHEFQSAFVFNQRFARVIDGNPNGAARLLVEEFHHNVQQADARAVLVNDSLCDVAFVFEKFQAILRVSQLALQRINVRAARGTALALLSGLRFLRIASDGCRV